MAAFSSKPADLNVILQSLGMILIVVGILSIIPLIVALYYGEDLTPFLTVTILPIIMGIFFTKVFTSDLDFQVRHAFIISSTIYLLVSVIGALPFLFYQMSFLDGFFEAMSGWTTTGLTMIADVESMPRSILFWRSFIQWLGGVGVIVLLLTVFSSSRASLRLYQAEARKERIKPRLLTTARLIWWIYIVYTLMGVFLFFVAGMGIFDSVNHSMVAISTGGFSVKNASLAAYNSFEIELVGMILMMLGGINFLAHYKFLTGDKAFFFKDIQLRGMVILILISSLLITTAPLGMRDALFQSVSALTNAGLSTADISVLNDFSKSILTSLMIIGGSAGSTSGALKILRVIIILKVIYWWIKQSMLPEHAVFSRRLGGVEIEQETMQEATVFSILYFMILGVSSLALMYIGYSGVDSLFETSAAQGNVGLSSGVTNSHMPSLGKIVLIFNMWVGRLEIIPVLVLAQGILGVKVKNMKR